MGAKTALVWVNVLKNSSGATTFKFLGASSLSLGATGAAAGSYWLNLKDIAVGATTVGAFTDAVAALPDFLRWEVTGANAAIQFEIVVYLYDT